MDALPGFSERLRRLAELRGLGAGALAERAGVAEAELARDPDPDLLRRLAPALGLHRSDLFLAAGLPLPDDLSPLDPAGSRHAVDSLAWSLTYLPRIARELLELARSLPQQPRPPRTPEPEPPHQQYPHGPGGLILRLLRNRNLTVIGATKLLYGVGRGPMLSYSTVNLIGKGQNTLTPELLAGLGAVLDITLPDLGALTGIDVTDVGVRAHPEAAEAAELLWEARRLTVAQVEQLKERAHAVRHEDGDRVEPNLRCRCPGPS